MLNPDGQMILMEPGEWASALAVIGEVQAGKAQAVAPWAAARVPDVDVIEIRGVLLSSVPEEYRAFGLVATGYDEIADKAKAAAASTSKAILIHVNSGGGMVDGVDMALDAIRAAAATKPVMAFVDGMAASAAYWLVSQAQGIYATRMAQVGGIGVYQVAYDTAGAAARQGLKAVVSRSGNQKGMGIFGDEITDTMKAAQDDMVANLAGMFMADVMAARPGIEPDKVGSGRVWLAGQAQELGLIDGIVKAASEIQVTDMAALAHVAQDAESIEEAKDTPEPEHEEVKLMDELQVNAVAEERARVSAIMAAFATDTDFARKHIEAGSTVETAKAEYCDVLQARMQAAANAQASEAVKTAASREGLEETSILEMADALASERNITLSAAFGLVARKNPEAYLRYVGAAQ